MNADHDKSLPPIHRLSLGDSGSETTTIAATSRPVSTQIHDHSLSANTKNQSASASSNDAKHSTSKDKIPVDPMKLGSLSSSASGPDALKNTAIDSHVTSRHTGAYSPMASFQNRSVSEAAPTAVDRVSATASPRLESTSDSPTKTPPRPTSKDLLVAQNAVSQTQTAPSTSSAAASAPKTGSSWTQIFGPTVAGVGRRLGALTGSSNTEGKASSSIGNWNKCRVRKSFMESGAVMSQALIDGVHRTRLHPHEVRRTIAAQRKAMSLAISSMTATHTGSPSIRKMSTRLRRSVSNSELEDHKLQLDDIAVLAEDEEALTHLPALIVRCSQSLCKMGPREEGLFRISARSSHVTALRTEFDGGADIELANLDSSDLDPHAVASILKAYLRELPESVLTTELAQQFDDLMMYRTGQGACQDSQTLYTSTSHAVTSVAPDILADEIAHLLSQLPRENFFLLREIVKILRVLASHSSKNKMPLSNLSLCLCPSLGLAGGFIQILCLHARQIWKLPYIEGRLLSPDFVEPKRTMNFSSTNISKDIIFEPVSNLSLNFRPASQQIFNDLTQRPGTRRINSLSAILQRKEYKLDSPILAPAELDTNVPQLEVEIPITPAIQAPLHPFLPDSVSSTSSILSQSSASISSANNGSIAPASIKKQSKMKGLMRSALNRS